jgi:hypothetical protein
VCMFNGQRLAVVGSIRIILGICMPELIHAATNPDANHRRQPTVSKAKSGARTA